MRASSEKARTLLRCPVVADHARNVYKKIYHRWKEVARCLGPIQLADYEIDQVQCSNPCPKEQTYKMLTTWIEKTYKQRQEPMVYKLCSAMIMADLRDAAIDTFGKDFVDLVTSSM